MRCDKNQSDGFVAIISAIWDGIRLDIICSAHDRNCWVFARRYAM